MLSDLQEAKAACFGAFRGEEELVTASRCLRSRLEDGPVGVMLGTEQGFVISDSMPLEGI